MDMGSPIEINRHTGMRKISWSSIYGWTKMGSSETMCEIPGYTFYIRNYTLNGRMMYQMAACNSMKEDALSPLMSRPHTTCMSALRNLIDKLRTYEDNNR